MKRLLLLAALTLSAHAHAAAPTMVYGPSGGTMIGGAVATVGPSDFTRLLQAGGTLGSVDVKDTIPATVQGRTANMTLTRGIPWANVARAGARALPLVTAGMVVYEVYDAIRCRPAGGASAECDAGAVPTSGQVWSSQGGSLDTATCGVTYACASDPGAALLGQMAMNQAYWREHGYPSCLMSYTAGGPYFVSSTNWRMGVVQSGTSCGGNGLGTYNTFPKTAAVCFSGGLVVPAGPDGKCATGTYATATEDALQSKLETYGDKARAVDIVTNGMQRGLDLQPLASSPGTLSGPSTVAGPSTTTTTTPPGGSPSTTTQTTNYNVTYNTNNYSYTTTTTTVAGDGTTTTGDTEVPEVEVCGLPGKPACKIDESGTPTGATQVAAGEAAIAAARAAEVDAVASVAQPSALGWGFGIDLPSGACSAFTITTSRFGTHDFFTVCGNSNVELMRSLLGWLLGILAALYCWRRVNETIAGV